VGVVKSILVSTWSLVLFVATSPLASRAAIIVNAPPTVIGDNQTYSNVYTINVSAGGQVGSSFTADGSKVTITGGTIGDRFQSLTTTQTTITGGAFGSDFFGGAGASNGGFTKISGGTFGPGFRLQDDGNELIGNDFRVNGSPVSGIGHISATSDVFTGVLKDGTVFILSPLVGDGFSNIGVKLTAAALPGAPVSPITVSAANGPRGLRSGSTLNLVTGGTLINNFAAVNSTLNISGGNTGDGLEVVGSQVTLTGGTIGNEFHLFSGSTFNMSGGTITQGGDTNTSFEAFSGSTVNISSGEVGGYVTANSGSQWNISGGHLNTSFIANAGSSVKITGGKFQSLQALNGSSVSISAGQFQPYFIASGNTVSLEGGEFRLNGTPYAGSTATLAPTDVLTGVLTDGNEFIRSLACRSFSAQFRTQAPLSSQSIPLLHHSPRESAKQSTLLPAARSRTFSRSSAAH
jgi:hypothetical protein